MLLVTIPGTSFKLDTGAQASLMRMVAAGMPLQITTAHRDRAYQQRLRDLYLAGKGNYALPPGQSLHEQGIAIDFGRASSAWLDFRAAPYGWFRPTGWNAPNVATPEWWHWEYRARNDTHKGDTMSEASIRDAVWARPVTRSGKKIPAIQELADAKTEGIKANGKLDTLLTAIKGLSTPTVDAAAVAATLAKNTTFLAALAKAVNDDHARRMGS